MLAGRNNKYPLTQWAGGYRPIPLCCQHNYDGFHVVRCGFLLFFPFILCRTWQTPCSRTTLLKAGSKSACRSRQQKTPPAFATIQSSSPSSLQNGRDDARIVVPVAKYAVKTLTFTSHSTAGNPLMLGLPQTNRHHGRPDQLFTWRSLRYRGGQGLFTSQNSFI